MEKLTNRKSRPGSTEPVLFHKNHTSEKGVIFQSASLEFFTRSNLWIHCLTYSTFILALLVTGIEINEYSPLVIFSITTTGFLSWTFFEYILHRFIFHIHGDAEKIQRFQFIVHGIHHSFPRDEERVFMPPLPGLLAAIFFTGIFYVFMASATFLFTAGMIAGYLLYSFTHYSMHHKRPPAFLKPLWKHHLLHHYKYPDRAFGVSTRFWDYVFGTMPPDK